MSQCCMRRSAGVAPHCGRRWPAVLPASVLAAAVWPVLIAAAPVAVDIGHSKPHPGATSARGKPEFEFNRELARVIAQTLQAQQMPAVLIGEDGGMVNLPDRTALASRLHAGFFLSVHHDSAQPQYLQHWLWQGAPQHFSDRFSGYSLFVSRKNPQLEISLHCARGIGQALQQAGLHASEHHAEPIAGENREWADRQAGVYYFDDLLVLKTASMPAVLLEAGVIINRDEEQGLQQDAMRSTIAMAVAQGLAQCGAQAAAAPGTPVSQPPASLPAALPAPALRPVPVLPASSAPIPRRAVVPVPPVQTPAGPDKPD